MLTVTIVAALLWCAALPLGALLAGSIGRRRVLIIGTVGITVWAYPYFALVESGSLVGLLIGSIVAALCIAVATGPYGAYLSEAFPAEIRYSGASIAYGIGGVLGGAVAPLVATLLVSRGLTAVAAYAALASVVSLVAVLTLRSPHPATSDIEVPASTGPTAPPPSEQAPQNRRRAR